jgi:hypothetical protein
MARLGVRNTSGECTPCRRPGSRSPPRGRSRHGPLAARLSSDWLSRLATSLVAHSEPRRNQLHTDTFGFDISSSKTVRLQRLIAPTQIASHSLPSPRTSSPRRTAGKVIVRTDISQRHRHCRTSPRFRALRLRARRHRSSSQATGCRSQRFPASPAAPGTPVTAAAGPDSLDERCRRLVALKGVGFLGF